MRLSQEILGVEGGDEDDEAGGVDDEAGLLGLHLDAAALLIAKPKARMEKRPFIVAVVGDNERM